MPILIAIIIVLAALCGALEFYHRKKDDSEFNERWQQYLKDHYEAVSQWDKEHEAYIKEKNDAQIAQLQKTKDELNQDIQNALNQRQIILNSQLDEIRQQFNLVKLQQEQEIELLKVKAQQDIDEWTQSAQEAAAEYANLKQKEFDKETKICYNELVNIKEELAEFQAKRAALNEVIRKEAEIENEVDTHRIHLSEADKQDIEYLLSIRPKIHNKELLGKLIWTEYLQKPFNTMINSICGSNIPKNVIYCIENITTKQKYIGKTTASYKDRMTNHIKASLYIGTISRQKIHDALLNNWDNFVFSIIEEVPNTENLSKREKYYIEMFESHIYGYNMKT